MLTTEARRIIEALAQGIDPETGEILPKESLLQRPVVIRALFSASQALIAVERKKKQADSQPGNAGSAWAEEEDHRLLDAFDQGATVDQLAHSHSRSKGGIAARLVRLGRIKERSEIYIRGGGVAADSQAPS
jgi:hypothetical protein